MENKYITSLDLYLIPPHETENQERMASLLGINDTAHAYETTQIKIEPTNEIIQQPWYKRLIQSLLFRKQITNI